MNSSGTRAFPWAQANGRDQSGLVALFVRQIQKRKRQVVPVFSDPCCNLTRVF